MKKYDAILVLGISTKKKLFKERVEKAVKLYRKGNAPKVIFSGRWWGGLKIKPRATEARLMSEYARFKGIPRRFLLLEEKSLDTMGNFYFTKKLILKPKKLRHLLIITKSTHIPKARYLAKKILGEKYRFKFVGTNLSAHPPEGHSTVLAVKKIFKAVQGGDDKAIAQILANHPYYRRYRKI